MQAISLHQPGASLIADGDKTIEPRAWPTSYRGDLVIVSTVRRYRPDPALLLGYALAIVEVVDCRPMVEADEPAACCDYLPGLWSWVLGNIRRIEPVRVRGRQRLFPVEQEFTIVPTG